MTSVTSPAARHSPRTNAAGLVEDSDPGLVARYGLGLLALFVGLALRLAYAVHASLYVDEFTTIWAAQRVLARGLPQFPSGAIYTQGLIYTYLDAVAVALGKTFDPLMARMPSLFLSVLTLALVVFAARRLYDTTPVGLAAFWLAVDAQAIIWGGRARTYALLQLLVLLAFLAWYRGALQGDRPWFRWLAIGLLLMAVIDQPLILLLLPPLALAALAARGWRWLRQPVVWLQAGVMAVALAARYLLYQLMVPAATEALGVPRAFVDLAQPFAGLDNLLPFLTAQNRLLPALILAGGLIWLLGRARHRAPRWRLPVLSCAFVLVFVLLEMLLFVGPTWRETRYLYPLLPLLFLGAEGVAIPALRGLAGRLVRIPFGGAVAGFTVALVLLSAWLAYPGARAATSREEWGYDRALAVVSNAWSDGDALATIAPAAAFVVMGHADYLAVEQGGQAMVTEREGQRIDGWTGLPLLDSSARLREATEENNRLWFVADEMRLDRHFGPGFLESLWSQFDLVAFERGTFVFRSQPSETLAGERQALDIDLNGEMALVGYSLSADQLMPGQTLTATLYWQLEAPQGDYVAFVHLVDSSGVGVAGHDAAPLAGLYPVGRWTRSKGSLPLPDRHPIRLPAALPPGRYRLEAGLYRPSTQEMVGGPVTLAYLPVEVAPAGSLDPGTEIAHFGDVATLVRLGLDGELKPGSAALLRLAWLVGPRGFDADYTVFLHLIDSEGKIAQQWDAPPVGGWYPTSYWRPGETVLDEHRLGIDHELAPGSYELVGGLYRSDGGRLSRDNGADSVLLATIEVGP